MRTSFLQFIYPPDVKMKNYTMLSMSESTLLLRFINPRTGPVISITSAPYPSFLRRWLWYSTARLHPQWEEQPAPFRILRPCGGGWSSDKEESQRKAVAEAIERWAFRYYSKVSPTDAGLNVNPTTDGFAALPAPLGEQRLVTNAYCEALERWLLNRMWDHGDIIFSCIQPENQLLLKLFAPFQGQLHCFQSILSTNQSELPIPEKVTFCLCVFETAPGGAIPGSACGVSPQATLERAILEAYIHVRTFMRMRNHSLEYFENILEKRLYYYGSHIRGYDMVKDRIKQAPASAPVQTPKIVFSKRLEGPWNPEVLIHRVMLPSDSKPANGDALERFLI